MLRLVIWLLLVANVGYFAWTQGYLAAIGLAPAVQTEPERLKAQVRPESLRLLNGPKGSQGANPPPVARPAPVAETTAPTTAAASEPASLIAANSDAAAVASPAEPTTPLEPPAPPTACWQVGGYTPAQAESLRAALARLDLPSDRWQLSEIQSGGRWVVYMGRFNEEQMVRKKTELRQMGVDFRETTVPSLGPGLALGTYSSEAAAQQALQDATRKGVRTARVAQERPESISLRLRLPAVTEAQRTAVTGLGAALAGKSLQRCD